GRWTCPRFAACKIAVGREVLDHESRGTGFWHRKRRLVHEAAMGSLGPRVGLVCRLRKQEYSGRSRCDPERDFAERLSESEFDREPGRGDPGEYVPARSAGPGDQPQTGGVEDNQD